MPILINPDYNGIIYSQIVSSETRKSLKNISKILGKIYKANLFNSNTDANYTFFNCYLLEIFPTINKLFTSLITVKLSDKIDKLIEIGSENFLKLKESNELYYFESYPEQIYNFQCICFSLNNVFTICKTVDENKNAYFADSKTKEKVNFFTLCNTLSEELKNLQKKLIHLSINPNKYYLFLNEFRNPNYQEELCLKNSKFTFNENENLAEENILSKVKFCIRKILKCINLINPRVYSSLADADTTEKFFLCLDKIIDLEDNSESINTIPLNWYSMYMTSYFKLLSQDYIKNNFSLLHDEMFSEAKRDIEKLKNISNTFNSKLGMNLRCSEKIVEYCRRDYLKLQNIENFIRIEKFIETAKIKVCIKRTTKEELQENPDLPAISIVPMETCIHQSLYYVTRLVDGKKSAKAAKQKNRNRGNSLFEANNASVNNITALTQAGKHKDKDNSAKDLIYIPEAEGYNVRKKSGVHISLSNYLFGGSLFHINNQSNAFGSSDGCSNSISNSNSSQNNNSLGPALGSFGECHCENIFEFTRAFQKFQEIKEDIEKGEAQNKIGDSLSQYLKLVFGELEKEKLFQGYDLSAKSRTIENIENYILKKMYKNVFPEAQMDEDIKFYLQCQKFKWIQPKHLEIKDKLVNEALWQQGINMLSRLDYEKTPLDKLNSIQNVLKIIKNSINFCLCEDEKFAGADDQNPIFIYMVIKAKLKKFISNINYIYTFIHDEKKTNYYGQTLSLMDFTKNFIMGVNYSFFSNMTKEEFDLY